MSVESVKAYLKQWNMHTKVRELSESCATVDLAANALGVIPARIAKSISFESPLPGKCILIVTAGDSKILGGSFKRQFGVKATMLSPEKTLELTGHAVGGVCPFGLDENKVEVYLDKSLKRFTTVFPACGSSNSLIELDLDELFSYSHANAWVDVCKGWHETVIE